MPVLNKTAKVFGRPLFLDQHTILNTISASDLGLISRAPDRLDISAVPATCKCIVKRNPSAPELELLVLNYLFNHFRSDDPLFMPSAFLIDGVRSERIVEHITLHAPYKHNYKLNYRPTNACTAPDYSEFYPRITSAIDRLPSLRITLDRFNSALLKDRIEDRIIDLCIALESLLSSQTEIAYRFSIQHAVLSKGNQYEAQDSFKLLKLLYDTRSKIVHGENARGLPEVQNNWATLLDLAANSISKYVLHLSERDHGSWQRYLDLIVFEA